MSDTLISKIDKNILTNVSTCLKHRYMYTELLVMEPEVWQDHVLDVCT